MNLPKKMKAIVAYGPHDYRYEEADTPVPGEGEIVIRVLGCGICGSDVKCYEGAEIYWGKDGNPGFLEYPVIPGHEFYGEVVAIGPHTDKGVEIGDHVTAEMINPCGQCRFCQSGNYNMCERGQIYGFKNTVNGAFAEYTKLVPEARVHKLPKDMPFRQGVLIEPFSCAAHGIDRGQITPDDIVVISGMGGIGLGMVGSAKAKHPKLLIGLDINDQRLQIGKEFGCDLIMNPSTTNVLEEIMKLSGGYGCDVYVEAAAHPSSVEQGLQMIRNQGRFVEFSIFAQPVTADWSIISDLKELTVYGSHLAPNCYEKVIKGIVNGTICTEGVVTHTFKLSEFEEAIQTAHGGDGVIKVAVEPD